MKIVRDGVQTLTRTAAWFTPPRWYVCVAHKASTGNSSARNDVRYEIQEKKNFETSFHLSDKYFLIFFWFPCACDIVQPNPWLMDGHVMLDRRARPQHLVLWLDPDVSSTTIHFLCLYFRHSETSMWVYDYESSILQLLTIMRLRPEQDPLEVWFVTDGLPISYVESRFPLKCYIRFCIL